jgi:hypothetical protein
MHLEMGKRSKMHELIRMTAEAELDIGFLTSLAARLGAERSVDATDEVVQVVDFGRVRERGHIRVTVL